MIIDTKLSNNEHIVRTTQQWESSAVKYKIIQRGCLCVELTPDGKTRVKIGEGNKYYEQLPYVDADIDMEEITHIVEEYLQYYATTEYVDTKVDVVDKKVDELDEDVTSLEETVDKYDERITAVEDEISSCDERITTVENEVSAYDDQIDSLEEKAHTHDNKSILDNTTASFTISDETKLDGIEDNANNYSLPKASSSTLGGIKVGDNLSIDNDGVLSANSGGYTLPPATDSTLGGIIVGDNLTITPAGVLSATGGGSSYDAGEGIRIDTHQSSNDEIVNTGVLDVTKNSSGNLVISKESGDSTIALPQEYVLPSATSSTLGGVKVGDNINVDANGVISVDDPPAPYSLPIASDTTLGGIKVGNNLTIDSETGVLSADAQSITVDDELDDTSENPVQNKVLTPALESLSTMITKISKQKVDLWWGEEHTQAFAIGNAFIYLTGIVDDSFEIGNATAISE